MHSSQSFLKTVVQRVRQLVDEPEVSAKYPDDRLMSDVIVPCMVEVWSRLTLSDGAPPILTMDLDIAANVTRYQLPPGVAEVIRIGQKDEDGRQIRDWRPQGIYAPWGPGWRLERNVVVFEPETTVVLDWTVDYIPSGDILAHYSESGGEILTTTTVKLASSPSLGMLDRRDNAYGGMMLRMIPTSGVIEERLVSAYDASTRVATLHVALDHGSVGTGKAYEVVPWTWSQAVWDAVAARSALRVATFRRAGNNVMQQLTIEYNRTLKTAFDLFNHVQNRSPKHYDRNTVDSPSAGPFGLG